MRSTAYKILFTNFLVFLFAGWIIWLLLYMFLGAYFSGSNQIIIFSIIFFVFVFFMSFGEIKADLDKEIYSASKEVKSAEDRKKIAIKDQEVWKASLKEKSSGYPTLFKAIQEIERHRDEGNVRRLNKFLKNTFSSFSEPFFNTNNNT